VAANADLNKLNFKSVKSLATVFAALKELGKVTECDQLEGNDLGMYHFYNIMEPTFWEQLLETGACAWCVGALLDNNAWRAENAHTAIPNTEQCAAHYVKGTFSVYWVGLDRLNKKHKETFTKFAVGYLARQQAAEGKPMYLKHVAFDAQNAAHVAEVLRVFFGPEVVSCDIVLCAYDARDRSMQVLHEDYAVYRPSAQHKPSVVARAVHGLDAEALARGEDIAMVRRSLLDDTYTIVIINDVLP
jgi:hypothetical protein